MKHAKFLLLAAGLFLSATAFSTDLRSDSVCAEKAVGTNKVQQNIELKQLIIRLNEIESRVKNQSTSEIQRAEYRNEVKEIQKKVKKMDGINIYLSFTAILIIILILIIL